MSDEKEDKTRPIGRSVGPSSGWRTAGSIASGTYPAAYPPGTITYPPITSAPTTIAATPMRKLPELVDLPRAITKKVLFAFLDEEDETVWAKKLKLEDFSIDYDVDEGTGSINVRLSLVKSYED